MRWVFVTLSGMLETPQIVETELRHYAYTRRTVPLDQIGAAMGPAIGVVVAALEAHGMAPNGPWFTHHLRKPVDFFDFEVCFPLAAPVAASGKGEQAVYAGVWPAMRVARGLYRGDYSQLPHAWGKLESWMNMQGLTGGREFWEVYTVNPHTEPNSEKWETELNCPLVT